MPSAAPSPDGTHIPQRGDVYIVIDLSQRAHRARVLEVDRETQKALLRVEGYKGLRVCSFSTLATLLYVGTRASRVSPVRRKARMQ
jgi:hypothetical protein